MSLDIIWGKIDLQDGLVIEFQKIPRELLHNEDFIDFIMTNSFNKAKIYEFVDKYINFFSKEENQNITNKFEYIRSNFKKL